MVKYLVTGSAGHLGEALLRHFAQATADDAPLLGVGVDILASPYTTVTGSISDAAFVEEIFQEHGPFDHVFHVATLHKPHIESHTKLQFIDVNVTGTQVLLDAAVKHQVKSFIFTSTTSTFGHAVPRDERNPSAGKSNRPVWLSEDVTPVPRNIYGATKVAAENLCALTWHEHRLPCVVLRTSRFFLVEDDNPAIAAGYSIANAQLNELLYRRVEMEDIVQAFMLATAYAPRAGFDTFIISAPPPFDGSPETLDLLESDVCAAVKRAIGETHAAMFEDVYQKHDLTMFPALDRIYDSRKAIQKLGWKPATTFVSALERVSASGQLDFLSPLALAVGRKPYHNQAGG